MAKERSATACLSDGVFKMVMVTGEYCFMMAFMLLPSFSFPEGISLIVDYCLKKMIEKDRKYHIHKLWMGFMMFYLVIGFILFLIFTQLGMKNG